VGVKPFALEFEKLALDLCIGRRSLCRRRRPLFGALVFLLLDRLILFLVALVRGLVVLLIAALIGRRLVVGEPIRINRIGSAPFFFLAQPLTPRVPRRSALRIHVTERAVLRAKLLRLSEERRICKRPARKDSYYTAQEHNAQCDFRSSHRFTPC